MGRSRRRKEKQEARTGIQTRGLLILAVATAIGLVVGHFGGVVAGLPAGIAAGAALHAFVE
jgi:hypothetical protein